MILLIMIGALQLYRCIYHGQYHIVLRGVHLIGSLIIIVIKHVIIQCVIGMVVIVQELLDMVGEEVLVEVMVHLILHVRYHILCLSKQVVNLSLSAKENCNTGCLGNWLGDRYCDQVCILSLTCNIIFHSVILSC